MLNSPLFRLISVVISALLVSACLSTVNEDLSKDSAKRATLSDLADNRTEIALEKFTMSKADRAVKLADIYQQLLKLEPDPNVRTDVEYRLVQINTARFENQSFGDATELDNDESESLTSSNLKQNDRALQQLVEQHKTLLKRYPNRSNNEHTQYQLAKLLDLQGRLDESLVEIESLLARYPDTAYLAELNFRRGEIYYNRQNYFSALNAYKAVLSAQHNEKYLINSIYMSGWSLFKLNRLPEADVAFLQVLEAIISVEKQHPYQDDFTFSKLSSRYQNLAIDTQRVLSISLSQQQQSNSLVKLVNNNQSLPFLYLYKHVLFDNLANFLIQKDLSHDAELTYQAYMSLEKDNIWSARFSLALLDRYHRKGKFASMHQLKNNYVARYGLEGTFWHNIKPSLQAELLPHLLQFSDEHSRRLYAYAQEQTQSKVRTKAFSEAATALATYLKLAKLPQAKSLLTKDIISDEYLYAEASFEAQLFEQALASYESIAYFSDHSAQKQLKLESAYATTITIREMLKDRNTTKETAHQLLIAERNRFDTLFIKHYPNDKRSLQLATLLAQHFFNENDYTNLKFFSDFVLKAHGVVQKQTDDVAATPVKKLSKTAQKQVQIVSQLAAHSLYKQEQYYLAENAYALALNYADKAVNTWQEMRNLLASSIYFQGQSYKIRQPQLAIHHWLRLGKVIPESTYRVNAEFDAANLLLEHKLWQQAIDVLLSFQQRYPAHEYSASISAKLAKAYEASSQWEKAAQQLLIIVAKEKNIELKREAQYTAAEYYLKAGNRDKALTTFRTYAHSYPEPFDVAQEVRFKMSEFYRHSKEPNKQYFWYRKILSFHAKQSKNNQQAILARGIELASRAAFGLGLAHQQTFKWIKLKAPLATSLKRKQSAMKKAINYYQQVLSFQLAHNVPQATFNLAEMYRQLALDVMMSERPSDFNELELEEYEIVLEELAYPFEEKAIEIHVSNTQRAWQNTYDKWIAKSFSTLAELAPALYDKQERTHDVINVIH